MVFDLFFYCVTVKRSIFSFSNEFLASMQGPFITSGITFRAKKINSVISIVDIDRSWSIEFDTKKLTDVGDR